MLVYLDGNGFINLRLGRNVVRILLPALVVLSFVMPAAGADDFIPRRQDKPPGPPKSPAEALAAMTVPEGFSVELVAAEPDVVNPVAMTIDERGRFWICESVEYPRREPGVGRDRVKVLEDTDGDGIIDTTTIFAEGLNIPSGIAVGHGGVWVANAPDILFLQDTDGDGKADTREVVVTGFGRDDTHELPNSLTWGPDGWLYGLNGVFNPSKIEQDGEIFEFTCAVFRIHPVTRKFEVWAEGTSNPWGIAFDPEGSLFVSACVIDHLWHLVETGYYIRQGGPYPPNTWILPSIVEHKHQLAAYCGLHYCDSDAFPPEWRNLLLMGNIHGACINADVLERNGSTYKGSPRPDFLSANDVWFMTVEQMTGPDGSLYVLDWYDRYHCYQDATADPAGVDRLHGRLYRVRYKDTPYIPVGFDLSKESDVQLIDRLDGGNDFLRATARRLLAERLIERGSGKPLNQRLSNRDYKSLRDGLWDLVNSGSEQAKRNALWTLISGGAVENFMLLKLFESDDATLRAWAVRAAGDQANSVFYSLRGDGTAGPRLRGELAEIRSHEEQMTALADDPSPDVRLQVAVAAGKGIGAASGSDPTALLMSVLKNAGDDPLIPAIVWQNLKPSLEHGGVRFLTLIEGLGDDRPAAVNAVLSRYAGMLLAAEELDAEAIAKVATLLAASEDAGAARQVLRAVFARIVSGGLPKKPRFELLKRFNERLEGARKAASHPLHRDAILLATLSLNNDAHRSTETLLKDVDAAGEDRLAAAEALIAAESIAAEGLPPAHPASALITRLVGDSASGPVEFRGGLLAVLGRSGSSDVARMLLKSFDSLQPQLRSRAIELLTQRPTWSEQLVAAIEAETISKDVLNVNQIRRLVGSSDKELAKRATNIWGTLREGRSPEREQIIADVRKLLETTPGDPVAGEKVFVKSCAVCHKIYGEGEEVGPDITRNGRNDFSQLLSNVLDPNLVIGAGYQARTVVTNDGRVLSGLVVEDTPQRIVLKLQGGKTEAIPRSDVEVDAVSPVSLMPEGLENQLTQQELADLFAYLVLDRPPTDLEARRLPGAPAFQAP